LKDTVWHQVRLGDVCDYYNGRITVNSLDEKSYISTENMLPEKGGITVSSGLPAIPSTPEYKRDHVLISNIRPYFKKIWYATRDGGCSNDILVFKAKKNCFPKYLYYVLSENKFFDYSTSTSKGTKMPRGDKSAIMQYSVPDIPYEKQQAIAATMSCLDDKIELNNRINANLEAQAQAIFKSWFVDFEPFRDGEFVDSELGKIPKGWRVGVLSDIGNIVGGSTPSKAKDEYFAPAGTDIAWITPKDLSINKGKYISHGEIDITNAGYENSSALLMPKSSVLFSSRAPIGYIAITKNEVCTNQGFKSIVPNTEIGPEYVYCFLKQNLADIENLGSGSTFKEISGSIMKSIKVIVPDSKTLECFRYACKPLFEQQSVLEIQNHNLSAIRDTLLPRLMSGEIRIKEENP
jgi:type I restriction enzyme S subunit